MALGLNASVFTIFNAYVLRPLAVRDPGGLYELSVVGRSDGEQWTESWVDWGVYQSLAAGHPALSEAAAARHAFVRIDHVPSMGQLVSGNYFQMLGVGAILGRSILPEDARVFGEGAVILLSHHMWQARFGADPDIVGKTIRLRDYPFTIVGVVGSTFSGSTEVAADFWAPVTMTRQIEGNALRLENAELPRVGVLGRLRAGVSKQQAENLIGVALAHATADREPARRIAAATLEPRSTPIPMSRDVLLLFAPIAVAFVLIMGIACANVANMMLARGLARQREIGIRMAPGAGRREVVWQLLTEALFLALPAALLGNLISRLALEVGVRWMFASFPPAFSAYLRILPLEPDVRVFTFMLLAAVGCAILFGLAPALQVTRPSAARATRGQARFRDGLVVVQIAACLLLLVVAGVFLRGAGRARTMETGLHAEGVLQVEVNDNLRERVLAELRTMPGIRSIAASSDHPAAGLFGPAAVRVAGSPALQQVYFNRISPEYLSDLGIEVLQGRLFTPVEASGELPVVILSATAAARLLPHENPIGREIQLPGSDDELAVRRLTPFRSARVIGVAEDVIPGMIFAGRESPVAYYPISPDAAATRLLLSASGSVDAVRRWIEGELERRIPGAVNAVHTLDQAIATQVYPMRAASWVSGALGGIAILLTLSGIYGVLAYLVAQRTREIGIRMALGAESLHVVRMVLGQSLRLLVIGATIGVSIALMVSRLFSTQMELISTFDPLAYFGSIGIALGACLVAAWVPSRRASRIDPVEALREE